MGGHELIEEPRLIKMRGYIVAGMAMERAVLAQTEKENSSCSKKGRLVIG